MGHAKYRVWCTTDSKYVVTVGYPTACPNNSEHNIVFETADIIPETLANKTQGYYQVHGFQFIAAPNTTTSYDASYPMDISIIQMIWASEEENRGDVVNAIRNPDTPLGPIMANITAGSNTITLAPGVASLMAKGFYLKVTEGGTTNDFGRIVSIDTGTDTVTMENNATDNFTAGVAGVTLNVHLIKDLVIGAPQTYRIGTGTAGSFLEAGNQMIVYYENKTASPKTITFCVSYYY